MIYVRILVTVPNAEHFDACTLCFDSIRTGFPTADLHVTINGHSQCKDQTVAKAEAVGAQVQTLVGPIHHAAWIRDQVLYRNFDGPLVILDADTVFWKSCEGWEFPKPTLWAGYCVPSMWNDFAGCPSMPRLHTSFMWFPDVAGLRAAIRAGYPQAHKRHGEYCPCDPFMPTVQFLYGKPVFWDTCANLYGMLSYPEPRIYAFEPAHLECYDHLNSAAFYDVMLERLTGDKEGFAYVHRFAVREPEKLRNLWPCVNRYYEDRAQDLRLLS